jgi:hypothetical protein
VRYEQDGVTYLREHFASYPHRVIAIRLSADRKGAISLVVRPVIAYIEKKDRTGNVTVNGDLITLAGTASFFNCNFEGQFNVVNEGGALEPDPDQGTITVIGADAVTIWIATGTNYRLSSDLFANSHENKLDPTVFPHEEVSARIAAACAEGYETVKRRHLKDVHNLFDRVKVDLGASPSPKPTAELLDAYKAGDRSAWLEELLFQYGRYLLIASSREKSLPANLQGAWSQYHESPWTAGYWHNINVQMNYWGAFSGNLAECFEAYLEYFKAYLPRAREYAGEYVKYLYPDRLSDSDGDNGWIVGTGANAYHIGGAGGHSGPGTGGFTSKLLMDYYLFTGDADYLRDVAYPAMLSLSRFYAKALIPAGDLLLVKPSASPEQKGTEAQVAGMPGELIKQGYYRTVGCTFDQGFVWENFNDTLLLAEALGVTDPFLGTIRDAMDKLDPILIGASGQIKEYREENNYSDIGDPKHRHISHLCPLYPGTLINSETPQWMEAAAKTLELRGFEGTTGWALAHRMNCWARLKRGDTAHRVYQHYISERTLPNLWGTHPPFQIDGNFGTMAGVIEMLLQSHGAHIEVLPALPEAWNSGSFSGLVARGNFVVSAAWKDGSLTSLSVTSRSGGECRLAYPGIASATACHGNEPPLKITVEGADRISFPTVSGQTCIVSIVRNS